MTHRTLKIFCRNRPAHPQQTPDFTAGERRLMEFFESLNTKLEKIMKSLEDLETDVAAETTVEGAMMQLVTQFVAEVRDLKNTQTDPDTAARIDALAQKVEDNAARMQAAVVANTPADPAAQPAPGPQPGSPAAAEAAAS